MSGETKIWDVHPDTEGIMSVKKNLAIETNKDNILISNLDFSERVFRDNPLSQAMTLQVNGQWQSVKIGKVSNIIYTVSSQDGQTRIDCCVYCNPVIEEADIKNIHFCMHSCQNQVRSCFTEAKNAVKSKPQAIKITCNKFSIIYRTFCIPDEIKMIETKCQFSLPNMTGVGLLKIKCWMEKEKANCYDLIKCLDYLIEQYLTPSSAPASNCRFILQGNKEIVEIVSQNMHSNYAYKEHIMLCRFSAVSVYPPF